MDQSSGKTTFALHAIAEMQKAEVMQRLLMLNIALDPKYAKSLGVDVDNLILSQPDTGEQAFDYRSN